MADDGQKRGIHGWVQTAALVVPLLLAVLAFFGIKNWQDWFGPHNSQASADIANTAAPTPSPTPSAPAPSPSAPSTSVAVAALADTVTPSPVRAALRVTDGSAPYVYATVTIRLHNGGTQPVVVAWREGERTMKFDLNDGTHLTASTNDRDWSGINDCGTSDPLRCLPKYGMRIAAGADATAEITFMRPLRRGETVDPATITRGSLIGTLTVATEDLSTIGTRQVALDDVTVTAPAP